MEAPPARPLFISQVDKLVMDMEKMGIATQLAGQVVLADWMQVTMSHSTAGAVVLPRSHAIAQATFRLVCR